MMSVIEFTTPDGCKIRIDGPDAADYEWFRLVMAMQGRPLPDRLPRYYSSSGWSTVRIGLNGEDIYGDEPDYFGPVDGPQVICT
jgi:hypothetical protein